MCARLVENPAQHVGTPVFYSYDPDYLSGGNQHWASSISFTVPTDSCLNTLMAKGLCMSSAHMGTADAAFTLASQVAAQASSMAVSFNPVLDQPLLCALSIQTALAPAPPPPPPPTPPPVSLRSARCARCAWQIALTGLHKPRKSIMHAASATGLFLPLRR